MRALSQTLILSLVAVLSATHGLAATLSSARTGNFFLPDERIEFSLALAPDERPEAGSQSLTINLLTYDRRIVNTISPAVAEFGEDPVTVGFPPQPEGFYRIEAHTKDASSEGTLLASGTLGVMPASNPVASGAGNRFGTIAHLKRMDEANRDQMLDLISRGGIGWIREGFLWHELEPARGEWKTGRYDDIVERTYNHGLSILPVLCFGNTWAAATDENHPPAVLRQALPKLDDWENYIREMVRRYGDRIHAWEIWNEPNLRTFWRPEPNAKDYAQVAARAYATIKDLAPDDTVLSAGLAPNHVDYPEKPEWGETTFVRELARLDPRPFDAIAAHPYTLFRHGVTRDRTEMLFQANLDNILAGLEGSEVSEPAEFPLWITEIGVSTIPRVSTEEDAAGHLVNVLTLTAARPSIERIFLYNFRDTGTDPKEKEHMFGLVRADYTPKPGYFAVRHFIKTVGDAAFVRRSTTPEGAVLHEFKREDGSPVIVAWAPGSESLNTSIVLSGTVIEAKVSNVVGDSTDHRVTDGKLQLTIAREPLFVEPRQSR